MPFCSSCGTKLNEGAKFCPNCGAKVAVTETTTPKFQEIKEVKIEEKVAPVEMKKTVAEEHTISTATTEAPKQSFTENVTIKVCHGCGKPFELTQAKEIFGHIYHNECFKCHICGQKLFSFAKFYNDNGEIMCHPCMLKRVPKCAKCGKPLVGNFVTCGGRNWHKECVPENL
ncbi:hypothetical protein EDI_340080 [Entamoeba dispar SAW760]|uniref:LIM zinc-binding domain-containing protein n=1 Tax=Entamoeba dispar (strain ATCC PRA-260 / SAW760) TaxID=370354 RepID=B0ES43_ENTDS|nr:uncharacterized protein EDI_340080 [Entamoeba dispar SAW760]EDR22652.1 hypothetical protein EDI_340080 [Entamoeba dispar SAW760]|eukprot:EDR22652.1 hypothetical protein EDI_340080 [Entamoeba dispar SAW760]